MNNRSRLLIPLNPTPEKQPFPARQRRAAQALPGRRTGLGGRNALWSGRCQVAGFVIRREAQTEFVGGGA